MATAESVKAKIQGLITQANEATGNADTNLTAAVNALIARCGQGGGNQVETGRFVVDSTKTITIPCAFEPDVIVITREEPLNTEGDVIGIVEFRIIKNWFSGGRYVSANGATTAIDGLSEWSPSGYGSFGLSYADGVISGRLALNGRNLQVGYTYNYIFGRCGM